MAELTESLQNNIDSIVENFDWVRAHDAMKALNWTWASAEGTPSVGKLVNAATDLLKDAIKYADDKRITISSGGLAATYDPSEKYLRLEFVIEEWEECNG